MRDSLSVELLGPDGAQDDPNLFEYFVEEQSKFNKSILVGRWGTGKTSLLLWRTRHLEKLFRENSRTESRPWYIEEEDLNIVEISNAFEAHSGSTSRRYKIFKEMWESEIYLRAITILCNIHSFHKDKLCENSWNFLSAKQIHKKIPQGIWNNAGIIINLLARESKYANVFKEIINVYNDIRSPEVVDSIYICCKELKDKNLPLPVISIEPIETPRSEAESSDGLANDLIASLITCWYESFRRERPGNLISVNVSVPWHRYFPERTAFPHRIPRNVNTIYWEKPRLRSFIEKRLSWQRDQYRPPRRHKGREEVDDVWGVYFPETVENLVCTNIHERNEWSFDYLCRHSSWRARDLLVLTRESILNYCVKSGIEPEEFFIGEYQVDEETIRETTRDLCEEIAEQRITEYMRRYNYKKMRPDVFRGLTSPLRREALFSQIADEFGANTKLKEENILEELWDSEIIGVCIEFPFTGEKTRFRNWYGPDCIRELKGVNYGEGDLDAVGFLFRGMTKGAGGIIKILSVFDNYRLIFNPTFHEYLGIKVNSEYPIGL